MLCDLTQQKKIRHSKQSLREGSWHVSCFEFSLGILIIWSYIEYANICYYANN